MADYLAAWQNQDPENRVAFSLAAWQEGRDTHIASSLDCDHLGHFAFALLCLMERKPELRDYIAGAVREFDLRGFNPSLN